MIQEALKTIPSHMVNQLGLVTFYVYGKKRQINNLLDFLQHQSQEILYEKFDGGVCIQEVVKLTPDNLQARHSFYTKICVDYAVEYDGFELDLEKDNLLEEAEIANEFSPDFKAGDLFSYKLKDGKYIIGIYYGGKYKDIGCLFNFYDEVFETETVSKEILSAKNLVYRTPVLLRIDSKQVNKLNINNYADCSCFFRVEIGEQSLDFFEQKLSNNQHSTECYTDILLNMYLSGEYLSIKDWMFMEYIVKKGKVTARDLPLGERVDSSYHFGVFGNMDMVVSRIKRENRDLVFLSDEVMKIS